MRLGVLAGGALPDGDAADVVLTAQWAAFICWVDDCLDRGGALLSSAEVAGFTGALRRVLETGSVGAAVSTPQATVLAELWERTCGGMPDRWKKRFIAEYLDFLDATEEEAALRRAGVRLPLEDYVRLRRRTITLLPMLDVLERTGHAVMVQSPRIDVRVRDLRWAVADVAGWANDLASGPDDVMAGQDNLVAVIDRQEGCSTAAARARAAAMIEDRRVGFRSAAHALRHAPLPSGQREELRRYVDLVERFMAATLRWLSSTGRFTPGAPAAPMRDAATRSL